MLVRAAAIVKPLCRLSVGREADAEVVTLGVMQVVKPAAEDSETSTVEAVVGR